MNENEDNVSNFATIGEIFEDGVSLIFDGQEEATEKHYKCNTSVLFRSGDRVKILPDSGTYVVEYVVGSPKQSETEAGILPTGGTQGQSLIKSSSENYDAQWGTPSGILPKGGSTGQILKKTAATDYFVDWEDDVGRLPSGGSDGQILKKSGSKDYSVEWGDAGNALPAGGTKGQALVKNSATNDDAAWGTPAIANAVKNQYKTADSYQIQFKTDVSGNFYIRYGTSGTWKKITVG